MTAVKRIVAALVCVVLIIAAAVLANVSAPVSVGAGTGQSAQIATIEDFGHLLRTADENMKVPDNVVLASLEEGGGDGAAQEGDAAQEEAPVYTSMTMTETSSLNYTQSYSYSGDNTSSSGTSSTTFTRKLVFGYTPDAVYYHSEGRMVTQSESSSTRSYSGDYYGSVTTKNESKLYNDFCVDVYIDAERVLLRAERLECYQYSKEEVIDSRDSSNNKTEIDEEIDKEIQVIQEHIGEWLDCTKAPSVASAFISINQENLQNLSTLGDFVAESISGEEGVSFQKSGQQYILDAPKLRNLMGVSDDFDSFSGSFTVDLTDSTKPELYYDVGTANSETSGSRSSVKGYVKDHLLFENIGNTVVTLSQHVQGLDMSELLGEGRA